MKALTCILMLFAHTVYAQQVAEPGYDVRAFLAKNLQYPKAAADSSIEGRVTIKCLVDTNGFLDSIQVMRSPHPLLAREALRLVSILPQPWQPARVYNKTVKCWYYIPVTFKLE